MIDIKPVINPQAIAYTERLKREQNDRKRQRKTRRNIPLKKVSIQDNQKIDEYA